MIQSFYSVAENLKSNGRPFAIATVISVRGSASAKPGSKALFDERGKNLWGWVGGGCAENFVSQNCLEAISERRPRIIEADLDDEVFGLGMPCGGFMDIFIEPQNPAQILPIRTHRRSESVIEHLADSFGFVPQFTFVESDSTRPPLEQSLLDLARALAEKRGADFTPMREIKGLGAAVQQKIPRDFSELLVVGSSRITEEMTKLGVIAKWPVRTYGLNLHLREFPSLVVQEEASSGYADFRPLPKSLVLVASHHRGDPTFISRSLEVGASYVGLIASEKRSRLILEDLAHVEQRNQLHAPAGLSLGAETPIEIALSVMAELIGLIED